MSYSANIMKRWIFYAYFNGDSNESLECSVPVPPAAGVYKFLGRLKPGFGEWLKLEGKDWTCASDEQIARWSVDFWNQTKESGEKARRFDRIITHSDSPIRIRVINDDAPLLLITDDICRQIVERGSKPDVTKTADREKPSEWPNATWSAKDTERLKKFLFLGIPPQRATDDPPAEKATEDCLSDNVPTALDKLSKAWHVVQALNSGHRKWAMSIPVRPDHDPDVVICSALESGERLIKSLVAERGALRAQVESLTRERDHLSKDLCDIADGCRVGVSDRSEAKQRIVEKANNYDAAEARVKELEAEVDRWNRADKKLRELGVEVFHDNKRSPKDGDVVIVSELVSLRAKLRKAEDRVNELEDKLVKQSENAEADMARIDELTSLLDIVRNNHDNWSKAYENLSSDSHLLCYIPGVTQGPDVFKQALAAYEKLAAEVEELKNRKVKLPAYTLVYVYDGEDFLRRNSVIAAIRAAGVEVEG